MNLLRKRHGEHPLVEPDTETPPKCEHVTLIPSWDRADDMGHVDRVSLYRCEACGETFTLHEAERLRETEQARLQRRMAS